MTWCNENNLSLNVGKTKELIIDFRKKGGEHSPKYINGTEVERVESVNLLRVTITDNLSWTSHVDTMVKKAQQCLFFLRKFGVSIRTLTNFYRCTSENILSGCITAWYGNCSAQDYKKLQKVVFTAQTIMEANLPSVDSIYTALYRGKAANIKDPSHPEFRTKKTADIICYWCMPVLSNSEAGTARLSCTTDFISKAKA
eukprot:g37882.t1